MSNLLRATIDPFTRYGERGEKRDFKQGYEQCRGLGVEAIAAQVDAARRSFVAAGAQAATKYKAVLGKIIGQEESELESLNQRLQESFLQEQADAQSARNSKLENLEQTIGPQSAAFESRRKQVARAEETLDGVRARLKGRPLRVQLVHSYAPIMIFLSVIEAPINRLSFELFFQEDPLISLLIAFGIGVALVFFAHSIGIGLKQINSPRTAWLKTFQIVLIVLAFVSAIVLIYFVAIARQQYVDLVSLEAGSSLRDALLGSDGGLGSFVRAVVDTELSQTGYTFLTINLVVFVIGIIASAYRHDPDHDYEAAVRNLERAEKRLHKQKKLYEKTSSRITAEYDEILGEIDSRISSAEKELKSKQQKLIQLDDQRKADLEIIVRVVTRRTLAYRRGAQKSIDGADNGNVQLDDFHENEIRDAILGQNA